MPDVVIVGAGIVGASIAYETTRRGAAVTLVDTSVPWSGPLQPGHHRAPSPPARAVQTTSDVAMDPVAV